MRFNPGDEITVDGEVVWRKLRHQVGRVTRLMVQVTRILWIESREMMELNLDDPVAFEAYLARKKDR